MCRRGNDSELKYNYTLSIIHYQLENGFDLIVHILCGEAQFLVQHLVGSAEAEALETPYRTVGAYQTFEVHGQTCGHTELLHTCGQDSLLVVLRLAAEQTFGGNADDAHLHAVLAQELCAGHEGRDLRTAGEQDNIGILV